MMDKAVAHRANSSITLIHITISKKFNVIILRIEGKGEETLIRFV